MEGQTVPARIDDRPRTPSGRLSRAFVPQLPVADLAAIKAAAAAEESARLAEVAEMHPDKVLYDAATAVDAADAALEPLRETRNRLVVDLWAFQSARGASLQAAAGVINMVFWRAKLSILGVDAIPKVEGTLNTTDWKAVRELAAKAGIVSDPNAGQRLMETASAIADVEGRREVALRLRDQLIEGLVDTGKVTRAAAGRQIARDRSAVSRLMGTREDTEAVAL